MMGSDNAAAGMTSTQEAKQTLGSPSQGVYAFDNHRIVRVPLATGQTLMVEQRPDGPVPAIADGTNRRLWPAACVLSTYLSRHPEVVQGKRVIELGAGSGAVGLACAALGASHVVLTDCSDALPLIHDNVSRNAPHLSADVQVRPCLWGDESHVAALIEDGVYDVVIACEVVYKQNASVLEALVETQRRLLGPRGVALLAYEYRGELFDDMAYFDAANSLFEVEPLSLRPYEGDLEDENDEDARWLYIYTHQASR